MNCVDPNVTPQQAAERTLITASIIAPEVLGSEIVVTAAVTRGAGFLERVGSFFGRLFGGERRAEEATTTVKVSRSAYPESAAHIEGAQASGQPRTLTVDRAGASARRREALQDTPTRPSKDRDEYPPAMFKEGGAGSSKQYVNPSDNRGAGASIGRQCRSVPDGGKVNITVCD